MASVMWLPCCVVSLVPMRCQGISFDSVGLLHQTQGRHEWALNLSRTIIQRTVCGVLDSVVSAGQPGVEAAYPRKEHSASREGLCGRGGKGSQSD